MEMQNRKLEKFSKRVRDSTEHPQIGCFQRDEYRKNFHGFRHAMLHTDRIKYLY